MKHDVRGKNKQLSMLTSSLSTRGRVGSSRVTEMFAFVRDACVKGSGFADELVLCGCKCSIERHDG